MRLEVFTGGFERSPRWEQNPNPALKGLFKRSSMFDGGGELRAEAYGALPPRWTPEVRVEQCCGQVWACTCYPSEIWLVKHHNVRTSDRLADWALCKQNLLPVRACVRACVRYCFLCCFFPSITWNYLGCAKMGSTLAAVRWRRDWNKKMESPDNVHGFFLLWVSYFKRKQQSRNRFYRFLDW